MSLVRAAARILTGSTYVGLGLDAARAPGGRVDMAGSTLTAIRTAVPLPEDDALVVRANAVAQVIAGGLLATGRAQRLSALTLVASLVPTTVAGHDFWSIEDPAARKQQQTQFFKNMALIGGLLFAVVDRPGHQERDPAVA